MTYLDDDFPSAELRSRAEAYLQGHYPPDIPLNQTTIFQYWASHEQPLREDFWVNPWKRGRAPTPTLKNGVAKVLMARAPGPHLYCPPEMNVEDIPDFAEEHEKPFLLDVYNACQLHGLERVWFRHVNEYGYFWRKFFLGQLPPAKRTLWQWLRRGPAPDRSGDLDRTFFDMKEHWQIPSLIISTGEMRGYDGASFTLNVSDRLLSIGRECSVPVEFPWTQYTTH